MPSNAVILAPVEQAGFTSLERDEMIAQALNMRKLRMPVTAIAKYFGVKEQTVKAWIVERIRRNIELDEMTTTEVMQLEKETLDQLQTQLQPGIEAGQLGAIALALRISESRRKLFGLDAPEAHDVRVAVRQYKGFDPEDV